MPGKSLLLSALSVALLCLAPPMAKAETFAVKLGNTALGELSYSHSGSKRVLRSTLANTPLGVFNGTFLGTSRRANAADGSDVQTFEGVSRSTRKSRNVQVQIGAGRALTTVITPLQEITALSAPEKAPNGVVDPVVAIGLLMTASGCPKPINIYDGRRAIALRPSASSSAGGKLTCDVIYKVTDGPGHLSPLNVSKAKMQLIYDLAGNRQEISQIRLGSGMFSLMLERVK